MLDRKDQRTGLYGLKLRRMAVASLTEAEMQAPELIRQALRLYQLVEHRLASGGKLFIEDEAKQQKAELMML